MKAALKRVVTQAACGAYAMTRSWRPSGTRVLMYHAVGTPVEGDTQRRYSITPGRFRRHMSALRGLAGRTVVAFSGRCGQANEIAITFDDGYRDTLEVAAPMLVERGLPFTVFVTPGFVRSGAGMYLTLSALRELAEMPGATIGTHGDRHVRLTACSDAELDAELSGSRAWMEDALGHEVRVMSYPHGAVDARVRAAAERAGFALAASSDFGPCLPASDRLRIPRIDIWAGDDEAALLAKLEGDWDWLAWRDAGGNA